MKRKTHGLTAVSILGPTTEEAKQQLLEASRLGVDVAELRLDRMEETCRIFFLTSLVVLSRMYHLRFILTYRRKTHGGAPGITNAVSFLFWVELFRDFPMAVSTASWIDWEFELVQELQGRSVLEGISIPWAKIIVSMHDFKKTPANLALFGKFRKMLASPAGVVKVACLSQGARNNRRLFRLYESSDKPLIVIGMGEHGLETRMRFREFPNALLMFGRLGHHGSAPGQPLVSELIAT